MEQQQEKLVSIRRVVLNKSDHPRIFNQFLSYFKQKSINFQKMETHAFEIDISPQCIFSQQSWNY